MQRQVDLQSEISSKVTESLTESDQIII